MANRCRGGNPFVAAAAQSLPDLGILANSAQLLRHITRRPSVVSEKEAEQ